MTVRNELDRENIPALTEAERKLLGALVYWGRRWDLALEVGARTWTPVMGPRPADMRPAP